MKNANFAAAMKIGTVQLYIFLLLVMMATSSCRTEFERFRTSTDPEIVFTAAMNYYDEEDYIKAQTLFELILNSFRGTAKAEDLYFRYAYSHYYLNNFLLASHYFETFSNTFTSSERREEADFMKAYANYQLSPNHRLDQDYTKQAIDQFQLFVNTYPNSDRTEECNRLITSGRVKLEKKEFEAGKLYYDLKSYNAAIHTFENVLKDFPESANAEQIRFLITKAAYEWADQSFYEKKEERYSLAVKKYEEFKKKFPRSSYMEEAAEMYNTSQRILKSIVQ